MVMEAKPSPQSVGREFVRQYYTLLNKAPDHLHRFYNQSSSFIHGGLDSNNALVVGQKNIHDKIQQLGFRDCHAKISHVDAQATLGEGVVVQVSGELSNDGQPMRRFTQTFVLACQSPKKYYVHNDIFRYQDIYTEDEDSGRGEGQDEDSEQTSIDSSNQSSVLIQQQTPQQQQAQQPPQQQTPGPVYYTAGVISAPPQTILPNFVASPTVPATATQTQPPAQVNGVAAHGDDILKNISTQTSNLPSAEPTPVANAPAQTMTSIPVVSPQPVIPTMPIQVPEPTVATVAIQQQQQVQQVVPPSADPTVPAYQVPPHRTPAVVIPAQPPQNVSVSPQTQPVEAVEISQPQQPITYVAEVEVLVPEEASDGGDVKDMNPVQEKSDQRVNDSPPPSSASSANQPKTYANLFKQGNSAFSQNNDLSYNTQISPPQQQQQQQQAPPQQNKYQPDGNPDMQGGGRDRDAGGRPSTGSLRRDGQMQRQRTNTFNDSHQLFFGNVPHRATEDELREIFAKFGRVVDLRIHTKSTAKNPSSRPLPNYGFITFEDQQSVQNCLNAMPIWFPDANAAHASKLNIEEKKRQNTPREGRRDGRDRDREGPPRNGNGVGMNNRGGSGNRVDRGDRDRDGQRMGGGGGNNNRPPYNRQDRGSIGPRTGGSNGSNYNNNNNNTNRR